MTWVMFILGAIIFVGASCASPSDWREQVHTWFGAWTGIIIMIIAATLEYAV